MVANLVQSFHPDVTYLTQASGMPHYIHGYNDINFNITRAILDLFLAELQKKILEMKDQ